jgi:hypothetical protein
MTQSGHDTGHLPRSALRECGLQAALKAGYDMLRALKKDGSLLSVQDSLASFEERQRAVGKREWDVLEARYRT